MVSIFSVWPLLRPLIWNYHGLMALRDQLLLQKCLTEWIWEYQLCLKHIWQLSIRKLTHFFSSIEDWLENIKDHAVNLFHKTSRLWSLCCSPRQGGSMRRHKGTFVGKALTLKASNFCNLSVTLFKGFIDTKLKDFNLNSFYGIQNIIWLCAQK